MSQENVEIVRRYFQLIDRMLGEYWLKPVPLSEYPETEEAFKDVQADAEWKPPHMERSGARMHGSPRSPTGSTRPITGAS